MGSACSSSGLATLADRLLSQGSVPGRTGPAPALSPQNGVIEVGEDYAVHCAILPRVAANGEVEWHFSHFHRIGNALHYRDAEGWKESLDRIDLQEDGTAAALHGPNKGLFYPDLNAEFAFEVLMADGRKLAGAVRGLQVTDTASGRRLWLGRIKESAVGQLLPPNKVLYRDAFEGLLADVVYEWRKDRFAQFVVLRGQLRLPEEWDPAQVRLEVVTEFWTDVIPGLERQTLVEPDGRSVDDAALIDLGRLKIVLGHAFPSTEGTHCSWGHDPESPGAVPVQKRWLDAGEGWQVLIESIRWDTVVPHLMGLPSAAPVGRSDVAVAGIDPLDELIRQRRARKVRAGTGPRVARPWVVSTHPLDAGYVIDFLILPQNQITNFWNGITYYVQSAYHLMAPTVFHGATVIKFKQNAHLRLFGPMTFPTAQPFAVLTSWNDDLYGEWIGGVPEETNSDGDPTKHRASEAIFVYYQSRDNTVSNVRIRWAQTALRYVGLAQHIGHTLRDSLLEQSDVGVAARLPPNSAVQLTHVQKSAVTQGIRGSYVRSEIVDLVVNASNWPHHQGEPAIAVRRQAPGDSLHTKVVIVTLSRTFPATGPDVGMVRMISSDGGGTWATVGYIATGGENDLPQADGDADPSLVYDDFGNLYLAYRGVGSAHGLVCAISDNDGLTFAVVSGFDEVMSGLQGFSGAAPRLAVGKRANQEYGSLWITLHQSVGGALRCATTEIRGSGWGNVGGRGKWKVSDPLTSRAKWSSIAVGPSGSVMVVYTQGVGPFANEAPVTYHTARCPGYPSADFETVSSATFSLLNMGETFLPGALVDTVPVLAWDRGAARNLLYLAYTSRAVGAAETETVAVVRTFDWSRQQWGPEVKVHGDAPKSQLQPWVAVDSSTGYVVVIWYANEPALGSHQFHLYATLSADGFASGVSKGWFRLSEVPADTAAARTDLFEYIGVTAFEGAFYPAFLNNGTGSTSAWDIFSGRVPF